MLICTENHLLANSRFLHASGAPHLTRRGYCENLPQVQETCATVGKAQDLLATRGIRALACKLLDDECLVQWQSHAVGVQSAIYELDRHYETTKAINWATEQPLWQHVEQRLLVTPGHSEEPWVALESLRSYANAERRIHSFDVIDPREFKRILLEKCADVRIARALLWSIAAKSPSRAELTFWSLYDRCWELIEDLVDLEEDGTDWNLNFWLYGPMAGLPPTPMLNAVQQLLERTVGDLEDARARLPGSALTRCEPFWRHTRSAVTNIPRPQRYVMSVIASGKVLTFESQAASPVPHNPTTLRSQRYVVEVPLR